MNVQIHTNLYALISKSLIMLCVTGSICPEGLNKTYQQFVQVFRVAVFGVCVKLLIGVLVIKERTRSYDLH